MEHKYGEYRALLGQDTESWGYSYRGKTQHAGQSQAYALGYGQGSIVGIHLDTWNSTLSFYRNRQPLGIAYRNLYGRSVYPMMSSTAARTGAKIIKTGYAESNLEYLCCKALRELVPSPLDVLEVIPMPPGLKEYLSYRFGWLLSQTTRPDFLQ